LPTLLRELVPDDTENGAIIRSASEKLVRLCKCYMEDGQDAETLAELVERFGIDMNGDDIDADALDARVERVYRTVPRALELCLKRRSTLDFDDQVWWAVQLKLPVEKFDVVMIDEAQDTNKMQQELVKLACP
jgi:superfamily I DNA/RNA helicase